MFICRIILLPFIVALMLSGCQNSLPKKTYEIYDFSEKETVTLDVAGIEYFEEYRSPFGPPHVEHKFPVKPVRGIKALVQDQIHPEGSVGTLRVTIIDASVVEEPLPEASLFNLDRSQYSGTMKVLFEIYKPGHLLPRAKFIAEVERMETITDNISLQSREAFYYEFTQTMLEDLHKEIIKGSQQYFSLYLTSPYSF